MPELPRGGAGRCHPAGARRHGGPQALDVVPRHLGGTNGDTDVYVLDSGKPGRHRRSSWAAPTATSPPGYMTAILIVEHAVPAAGRLLVVPHANRSSVTHTDYQEASPRVLEFQGASGRRAFRYGSRATNPTDQWPDPDIYVHAASGQQLSGAETRNLNRAYPGRAGRHVHRAGRLRHRVARPGRERVDLVVDLHEASPEYPVVNAIVAHERAMPVASAAVLNLEFDDITIGLEPSPKNLRGLSHRELGDATDALADAVRDVQRVAGPAARRHRRAAGHRGHRRQVPPGGRARPPRRALRREGLADEAARGPSRGVGRGDPRRVHVRASGDSRFPSPGSPPTPT
ncbi:MAG: succinylglutamate desuccinylase/aspartoacylase family protein [Rhodopseudomonas palustris]|nr:succinylglutamate desuccinylase/aspartoacylase family protein [Rhodopseudomonas palustris]